MGTWKKNGITAEGVGEESNILSCINSCQAFTLSCPQSSFLSRSSVTSMLPSPRPVLSLLRRSHEHVTRQFFLWLPRHSGFFCCLPICSSSVSFADSASSHSKTSVCSGLRHLGTLTPQVTLSCLKSHHVDVTHHALCSPDLTPHSRLMCPAVRSAHKIECQAPRT